MSVDCTLGANTVYVKLLSCSLVNCLIIFELHNQSQISLSVENTLSFLLNLLSTPKPHYFHFVFLGFLLFCCMFDLHWTRRPTLLKIASVLSIFSQKTTLGLVALESKLISVIHLSFLTHSLSFFWFFLIILDHKGCFLIPHALFNLA